MLHPNTRAWFTSHCRAKVGGGGIVIMMNVGGTAWAWLRKTDNPAPMTLVPMALNWQLRTSSELPDFN